MVGSVYLEGNEPAVQLPEAYCTFHSGDCKQGGVRPQIKTRGVFMATLI